MTTSNGNGHHSHQATTPPTQKPRLIFWELTKGCNLRCIHCRASATELSSPSDLSTQAARDIIDQIAEVSSPILVLSGGEPLFRSDIFQLARYGTDKGLRVALATNGTLVTKASCAEDCRQRCEAGRHQSGWRRCRNSRHVSRDSRRLRRRHYRFPQPERTGHVGADQHHHCPPQCPSTSRRARTGADRWERTRCTRSYWSPWDAASISPPSRWFLRKNMSAC